MGENGSVACLDTAGRVSNEQLYAWLMADARDDRRSFQSLFQAVAPLLLAYFDGQLRGCRADLEVLTLETLVAVYQHRASFDPAQPFRAWLLGLARLRAVQWRHGTRSGPLISPVGPVGPVAPVVATSNVDVDAIHMLRQLAREQVDGMTERGRHRRAVP